MVSFRLALAAAVRMVDGIHRDSAHMAALAEPSGAPRLADRNILVVEVADLADSGAALRLHHPLLSRRELEQRHLALFCHQLRLGARAARQLSARAGLHLDPMDDSADRNIFGLRVAAWLVVSVLARPDLATDLRPI